MKQLAKMDTPSIPQREYSRRRRALMAQMEADSIAILPSAGILIRNRDAEFKFRQDSDFSYLSGFNEPDAVLVLVPGRARGEFIIFCRERDPLREQWDGYRQGPAGVCKHYGADDAFPIGDIDDILPGLLEGRERVYYAMGRRPEFDRRVMAWVNVLRSKVRAGAHPPGEFLDLDHLLHDMRLYKSAAELRILQRAADISVTAHRRVMRSCRPGMMEYQLEAELLHEFTAAGAQAAAYNSIVGSGKNACILHYVENSTAIRDGDLVLIDAGCELNSYAADITRTFPSNGKFTAPQQALYEVVLSAQRTAIAQTQSGNNWNDPHDATVAVITQGLLDLGILDGEFNELIESEAYKPFYMHRAGHWLGMDVHDVGDYKVADEWRVLEPGMVTTVEPGLYISGDDTSVAVKWRGMGIRIEDDVVVTRQGPQVLTGALEKTVSGIERVMRRRAAVSVGVGKRKAAAKKKTATKKKASVKKKATANKKVTAKKKTTAKKKAAVKKKSAEKKSAVKKKKTIKKKSVAKTESRRRKS